MSSERGNSLPTGVHLSNARGLLFDAAERVLERDGVGGLTSRAVTDEAGVAKGVIHRHFSDFDSFLAELILDRTARLQTTVTWTAGADSVVDDLTELVRTAFTPLAVSMAALVITRNGLRERLREVGAARFPLLEETTLLATAYLREEQALGRISLTADVQMVAHLLIASVHLLFTDREVGRPDIDAVRKVVAAVMQGAVR